jgi:hypothetical protein
MMIGLTEAIIGGTLYLLWKGGVIKKQKEMAKPAKPATPPVKPAAVQWPTTEPPVVPPPIPAVLTEKSVAIHQAESDILQQRAQLDREVAEAKRRAGADKKAQADIARREAERRKALADYQADIERAKR